jgi:tripartite ATP-independent transporter DctM subunit
MLLAFFICLVVLLFLGFPIFLSLFAASAFYILINPDLSFMVAAQKMLSAPDSFTLLAVPFFLLAGQLMNNGGVTTRIYRFSESLCGYFRGGLGYVNVLGSMIFAGMSGSAAADAGGLGAVEIKAMRDAGYDDDFTIGVTAASSLIGPIIPPSVPFVIYGAIANVSVGGLFIGGIIPGLIMGAALYAMVYIVARKRNYPRGAVPALGILLRNIAVSFKSAIFALLTPAIIIGGIWFGFFTPTEAALVSVVYALVVTIYVYRDQKWKDIPPIILDVVRIVPRAILIVGAANLFGWIMNYEKVDQVLMNVLFGFTTNKWVILLIINLILFVMGMFLEVISALMLFLPILQPIIANLGIHPIHLGVIMVLNLMIGLLTPPVGFVLYMLAIVGKLPVQKVIRYVFPWIFPLVIVLFLITFIPDLVMFLPRLMGFAD